MNQLDHKYDKLNNQLELQDYYNAIYIDLHENEVPEDRRRRFDWFKSLKLSFKSAI